MGIEQTNCTDITYDGEGKVASQKIDTDCDGEMEPSCISYTRDELDNKVAIESDFGCDDVIESCRVDTFNEDEAIE